MGKRKNISKSQKTYINSLNENINNTIMDSVRLKKDIDTDSRKTDEFYTRYLRGTDKKVTLFRNISTIFDLDAKTKFHQFVSQIESGNNVSLKEFSKNDLMLEAFKYAEKNNGILVCKDDSRQFFPYKILMSDRIKLYLYKLLCPLIFDYDFSKEENCIVFKSKYIENNIGSIYRNFEMLFLCIVYDAFIISIVDYMKSYIEGESLFEEELEMKIFDFDSKEKGIKVRDYLQNLFSEEDEKNDIYAHLILSIIFFGRYYNEIYRSRKIEMKKHTDILKVKTFYAKKRAYESRKGLSYAYDGCNDLFGDNSKPFIRLLNMYFINSKSYLFDLGIIQENVEYAPYMIDGIVTKSQIHKMIQENSDILVNTSSDLKLSSIYCNPNCVIKNISSRDYEMLNYIITTSVQAIKDYYFEDKSNIVARANEIIHFFENHDNLMKTISYIVDCPEEIRMDIADYNRVMSYHHILYDKDDE